MGAILRIHEWRTERKLAREATKGVVAPAQEARWPLANIDPADAANVDRRSLIPPLGLREYWYPALPLKKVGRKPLYWRMLGDELVLFRDDEGGVAALSDVCPHRGASLAKGDCFFKGTVSCPYHGATFDKKGDCVAFITEGPASKMTGNLPVRSYPTRTLRGWVFIWMGEGEPSPIEDDVPPEFFEDESTMMLDTYTYWASSWILAIENQNDAHNCIFVHRNSMMQLTAPRGRQRTPLGPRTKLIKDRALVPGKVNQQYYADENGNVPFQMHYPGVDGKWPKTPVRKWVHNALSPLYKHVIYSKNRLKRIGYPYQGESEEWAKDVRTSCWHLPCMVRVNFGYWMYTRYAVPVTENVSRIIYFHNRRVKTKVGRVVVRAWYHLYFNWWLHYNFSTQDGRATTPCRYWTEETFAPTDSHLIMLRKLITERSRDAKLHQERNNGKDISVTAPAEERVFDRMEEWGIGAQRVLSDAEDETVKGGAHADDLHSGRGSE